MSENWREIAEQVTAENDPAKLAALIPKLCNALDQRWVDYGYKAAAAPADIVDKAV
jgi:hypothetical protein